MHFARPEIENKITFSKNDSLYKYFPIERIFDFIDNGLVRFTVPFVFNDPFEIMPIWVRHNWSPLPGEKNLFLGLDKENPLTYFGVLSLTDSPDNHLMWSHYTNSYKGFVIEFDKNHNFFKTNYTQTDFSLLRKVTYTDKPPFLNGTDKDNLISYRDNYMQKSKLDFTNYPFHLYFTKNNVWSYENEWRLLKFRDNADKVIKANESNISSNPTFDFENIHLFQIPFDAVKSIILGAAMSENKEFNEEIRNNEKLKHIKLYHSMISVEKYSILFREMN